MKALHVSLEGGSLRRVWFAFGFAFAVVFTTRTGSASAEYPAWLETRWGVTSLPVDGLGCRLCHQNDNGGAGTATKKFAVTLRKYELVGGSDKGSLYTALDAAKKAQADSDADGFADYDEIHVDLTDPNDKASHGTPVALGTGGTATGTGGTVTGNGGTAMASAGASSSAGAPSEGSGGASGAPGAAGGVPGVAGAPDDGGETDPCTTEIIYPTASYGCQLTGVPPDGFAASGALLALCGLAYRVRSRRDRRAPRA